ncbi:hypothetical protein [Ruegeria sp.]|uniref:hypothetical protein n=1 Tax=Ruegeria sp. TaxID=1879320 RepID=UPI003C7BA580
MNLPNGLAAFIAAVFLGSTAAYSETYKESFECTFGRGVANRPTPVRLVFSVDEFGRSASLHEVDIPKVDTTRGHGIISSDSIRRLSFSWFGRDYTYSATGLSAPQNGASARTVDLQTVEYSFFLNRRTMKAAVRSEDLGESIPLYGNAQGTCQPISTLK